MSRARAVLLTAALLVPSVATVAPAQVGGGAGLAISMGDNFFQPKVTAAAKGVRITWTNQGRSPHNVRTGDGKVDLGIVNPGQSVSYTVNVDEVFAYYCKLHASTTRDGMSGRITIGAGGVATDSPTAVSATTSSRIKLVPKDFPTVQKAVDAAKPGDAILISPGVYKGTVVVHTPDLIIRGLDRNKVVLDAGQKAPYAIAVQGAKNVTIENLTARNATLNNIFWTDVTGYAGRFLTSSNSGDYGIFAFDSVGGVFEDSYASGSVDSAFYIGQCRPCDAVIRRVKATGSGLGYSGTNAGGNLVIEDSEWWDNYGGGITPNSLTTEKNPPQDGIVIRRNFVHHNQNTLAPQTKPFYATAKGIGILIAGGINDVIEDNRVENNSVYGIAVIPLPDSPLLGFDIPPNTSGDTQVFIPSNDVVRNNTITESGLADLALAAPAGMGNCFSGNHFDVTKSLPVAIETTYGCGNSLSSVGGGDAIVTTQLVSAFAQASNGALGGDWRTYPPAPAQPTMANPEKVVLPTIGGLPAGTPPLTAVLGSTDSHPRTGGSDTLPYGLAVLAASAVVAGQLALGRRRSA